MRRYVRCTSSRPYESRSNRRNLASSQDFTSRGPRRLAAGQSLSRRVISKARDHGHWRPRRAYAYSPRAIQIASGAALPFVRSVCCNSYSRLLVLTDAGTAAWLRAGDAMPSGLRRIRRSPCAKPPSSPAIAQRRLTIRLIDCSAFSSTASQRSIARKIGPFLMSARSSHSFLNRRADQEHPALLVGVAGLGPAEFGLRGAARSVSPCRADQGNCAGGSFLSCSTLSRATSLRRGARLTRTPEEGSRDPADRPSDRSRRLRSADPGHPG